MSTVLLHFVIGLFGSGTIFFLFFKLSRAGTTSAPFGLVFLAVACGACAHYISPWATPAILGIYAAGSLAEHLRERREGDGHGPEGDGSG